jgi:hypothetical protein
MISADFAENLVTGRTAITNRKKECEKYLKEQKRHRSRSYEDDHHHDHHEHKYLNIISEIKTKTNT